MAILKIARMGHPVLRQVAEPVADPTAPEIYRLLQDMLETLEDADGAGLAAPQVHVPLRVALVQVPAERLEQEGDEAADKGGVPLTAMINPVIEPLSDEQEHGWEACLSVPGLAGSVPRFTRIRYRYQTPEGDTVEREAAGFHARVVQHECDHLDGILYPMRMDDMGQFGFVQEMQSARRRNAEEVANADEEE